MPKTDVEIVCRVVDNFGDAGVAWRLARQLAHEQGTSFVIATHDDRMLAHCDRALMLDDGVLAGGSYAH